MQHMAIAAGSVDGASSERPAWYSLEAICFNVATPALIDFRTTSLRLFHAILKLDFPRTLPGQSCRTVNRNEL